jgi:intracellular sulfur oxidation DsrE/DsrF family protein
MRRTLPVRFAILLLLATLAFSQTPKTKHHAVFQMSEAEAEWSPLIAHVVNLRTALKNDGGVEVEVVFFGPGIDMLRKTNERFAEDMKLLADHGVVFSACRNSMHTRGIKTEDLFPFARTVDSGVAELVRKQEAGWAYIK